MSIVTVAFETCAICTGTPFQSDGFDHDLRTVYMRCFYTLDEGAPGLIQESEAHPGFYQIRVCKDCRGEWIEMVWKWAKGGMLASRTHELRPDANIPYRIAGRVVMLTMEEYQQIDRGGYSDA